MPRVATTLAPARIPRSTDTRARLIEGLIAAVEQKGYAATTIADVVGLARVSKRTFYEHFVDKDACFVAAYAATSDQTIAVIAAAAATAATWQERVSACAHAYLRFLGKRRAVSKTMFLDVHAAGPAALQLRRKIHGRFSQLFCTLVETARADGADVPALSPAMATALVGGINELVLTALEKGPRHKLETLADPVAELIRAVIARPR